MDGVGETAEGPAFLAKVRAVPEDGAANRALIETAATWLGLPRTALELVGGGKSRIKSIAISGDIDAIELLLVDQWHRFKADLRA